MNEYEFEIEYEDGYTEIYCTCAVNKVMAYDMLTEYLEDCGVDPATVKADVIAVHVFDEEEEA